MPKKQNGFGNVNSRFFNGFAGVEYGSGVGAAGYYPSYRGFGSSAHLSVIEKWDRYEIAPTFEWGEGIDGYYHADGHILKKDGVPISIPQCRECVSQPKCSKAPIFES